MSGSSSTSASNTFRGLTRFAGYAVVLIGLMVSQCVCQNNRTDGPAGNVPENGKTTAPAAAATATAVPTAAKPAVEIPKSVDTKDLDADEKAVLAGVLSEQYDPCGSPDSFLVALKGDKPCELATELAAFSVKKVSQGLSKRQVTRALLKELSRRASKLTFDLEGVPYYGDKSSDRIIVKFTDFQCPYCRRASQPAKDIAKKHGAVLYLKMMPLDSHEHAKYLANAAIAAHEQGKFWEAYAAFFENQPSITPELARKLVEKLGLDMAKFDEAMKAGGSAEKQVLADVAEGDRAKLGGTPTFYVDGYLVEFDNLEEALKKPKKD